MINKKFKRIELFLVLSGLAIFLVSVAGFVYALNFLSSKMVYSFSSTEKSISDTHFDIEGFRKLNL